MPGIKRLRSIASGFAQHALSGLCAAAPERDREQREKGVDRLQVLLWHTNENLADATGLAERLLDLFAKERIGRDVVVHAEIEFEFRGQCRIPDRAVVRFMLLDGRSLSGEATLRTA